MYKLLIADDEYEIRNGLSNYFPWSTFGFEVVGQAENGQQVLDYIAANPLDVLLCDIRMPLLNGIEVAKAIFNKELALKTIFISGYKEFEYARQALQYGVSDYIVKPTKYDELVELCLKVKAELDRERNQNGVFNPDNAEDPKGFDYHQQVVNTVKNYIANHYKDATLEEAAKLVHMNPVYLSKFFKEKTGENFSDLLLVTRMKKAAELLLDISYRTYEVSEMIGYSNPKNFTRTFKQYHGKTPKEYRSTKTGLVADEIEE